MLSPMYSLKGEGMVEWIEKTDLAEEIKHELQRLFDESQEIENSDEWACIAIEEELQAIAFGATSHNDDESP